MKTMLIADDEEVITFALQAYFELMEFTVDVAPTREAAIHCIGRTPYDVVVADLRLSGTEGTEGLDVIRAARQRNARTVILLLTAYLLPNAVDAARAAGADLAVQKPRPLAYLEQVITMLLAERLQPH
jgi:CheY-like chemotaxis protein